ncbi:MULTISPECIES: hypothetical protein [unclassified Streptomyces]|uniref:hypothetical protein n=1 Tax=unclassified Streptomyces TaxID=2593676 RepID=UPI00095C0C1B|nr:hypothetical protein [Streptomyces sp. TSRI0281]OKI41276.1 hypothetical protein A6A29_38070 [Streptomyces sp. TSRI0281]
MQVLAGGAFLFHGAVQVPHGYCGKQAAEPGSRPQILHSTGQKGPGDVPWLTGPSRNTSSNRFEEIGQLGNTRILRHLPAPPHRRVTELNNTTATPRRQT